MKQKLISRLTKKELVALAGKLEIKNATKTNRAKLEERLLKFSYNEITRNLP